MKATIIKVNKGSTTSIVIRASNTAIPNMLRTILQTEIPVYAVDVENIEYGECDTIFPNERISHIIGLIPVKQNLSSDVSFSLHAKFNKDDVVSSDTCFEPRNIITSNDIKSSNGLKYFHPDVPIIELRKDAGQVNIDKMTLVKQPQLYHARHQACKTIYRILEQKSEKSVLCELVLKPISRQMPEYSMDTYSAFKQSLDILIEKCKLVRSNIENDIYVMSESSIDNLKIIKLKIDDQPRQFGYLLQSQVFDMPGYGGNDYLVGFHNSHPLQRQFIFTMQWDTKKHKGSPKAFLIKSLTSLIKIISGMQSK